MGSDKNSLGSSVAGVEGSWSWGQRALTAKLGNLEPGHGGSGVPGHGWIRCTWTWVGQVYMNMGGSSVSGHSGSGYLDTVGQACLGRRRAGFPSGQEGMGEAGEARLRLK